MVLGNCEINAEYILEPTKRISDHMNSLAIALLCNNLQPMYVHMTGLVNCARGIEPSNCASLATIKDAGSFIHLLFINEGRTTTSLTWLYDPHNEMYAGVVEIE